VKEPNLTSKFALKLHGPSDFSPLTTRLAHRPDSLDNLGQGVQIEVLEIITEVPIGAVFDQWPAVAQTVVNTTVSVGKTGAIQQEARVTY
jgi:hypothetical protein